MNEAVVRLAEEARNLLQQVGNREIVPYVIGPTWSETFGGNVVFQVGGWTFTIFNDCGSWDYVDSFTAPDGRAADFDDLNVNEEHTLDPADLLHKLDAECCNRMEKAFESAVKEVRT